MIIDIHVHLIGLNAQNGCFVSPKLSSGVVFHLLTYSLGLRGLTRDEIDHAYHEQLVDWVHECDVDAVGLLALDAVYDSNGRFDEKRTQIYVPNDYCFEVCSVSDQVLPIPSINPQRRDALDELERVSELGAVALKALPNSQDFDPANPDYIPFWRRVAELEIPLLTHTSFEHTIPAINQEWGNPDRLRGPLDQGVKVIAAHCASSGIAHLKEDIDKFFALLPEYENLWGDISAMGSVSRFPYLRRVLQNELATERAILGSDFPIPVSPMVFAPRIGFRKALELGRIKNPLQKNLETFRAFGVPDAIFHRGAEVLRLPKNLLANDAPIP